MLLNFHAMGELKYNRIKAALDERGIKQSWLATQHGKSYRTMSLYTSNEVQPHIPVLYEIGKILNMNSKDLLVDGPLKK